MAKIVNPNAAGIDIGSNVHYVAVAESKCKNPVRSFKGFTKDLHELAKWLVDLGIETVAMESTGVNLKKMFPSVKQFLSWLNLVPDNKISGVKVLSSKVRKSRI
ncbi:MAG: hypothetical protein K9G70_07820 [Prolixibacteraceae bacterium]|nr:hypothetical protein [Prolixibacteraceae bacterium]